MNKKELYKKIILYFKLLTSSSLNDKDQVETEDKVDQPILFPQGFSNLMSNQSVYMTPDGLESGYDDFILTSRVQALYSHLDQQKDSRLAELKKVAIDAQEKYSKDCQEGTASFDIFKGLSVPAKAVFNYVEQNHLDLYLFIQKAFNFLNGDDKLENL